MPWTALQTGSLLAAELMANHYRPDIRPMHVGKFLPPPYAGIEAHVDTLLRSLASCVDSALVVCTNRQDSDALTASQPYRVIACPFYGKVASAPIAPGILRAVRQELADGRSNLLHVHAPNPWADLAALGAGREVPVVMTWHSDIVRQRNLMKIYRQVQRRAIERADRIIVFTPMHLDSSTQLRVPGVDAKVRIVPIGINFEHLDTTPIDDAFAEELRSRVDGRRLIATVGRHVYYKGYRQLLLAVARMKEPSVLAMVGDGPLSAELQRQALETGIADRVLFLGEVTPSRLVTILRRCDVFTLPSIEPSEAFGIASAEAMAMGKPTVVCRLGNGVDFLNRDGVTSLVVPPMDIDALADALDILLRDEAQRAAMGQSASAWVRETFSIARMREQTLTVYRELLSANV
jgi:rhamnosyl/mannosyltransferase